MRLIPWEEERLVIVAAAAIARRHRGHVGWEPDETCGPGQCRWAAARRQLIRLRRSRPAAATRSGSREDILWTTFRAR
ncbi:MAG: hypothetical protein ACYC65_06845 [Candidatus Limnocylindrales bacterium]